MSFFLGLFYCLATALVVILGDVAIKYAADRSAFISRPMATGLLLYGASAMLWFGAMRNVTLGQGAVYYSMLTLIALSGIGAVLFGEPLGRREAAGLGCAVLAMALMSQQA